MAIIINDKFIFVNTISLIKFYERFNMLLSEALKIARLNQAEAAAILNVSPMAVSKRVNKNSELKVTELIKIQDATGCDLLEKRSPEHSTRQDRVEIKYLSICDNWDDKLKNPLVTSVWFDRELLTNIWRKNPDDLRIVKMIGDRMSGGEYPLKNDDILIIDISETEIINSGIYIFTTQDNENVFINTVEKKIDGGVRFTFFNKYYDDKVYTLQQLEQLDFKIIGRVIKNLSLTK